ncbi:CAP domain-containing protein [Fredinandcohnia sp. QZ13]|uniref:CAP domain-containing protein n=1 Tax=Fredinandcohnia sp. QZ13 TaxID=3073144 RepID=UPI0028530350|nr:CAP domain-containing protein [Fredinandcohnia sp. QZ13]MDR4886624.1 CAP domain-containing protein [Fredinandcohnia sp. QZ13]
MARIAVTILLLVSSFYYISINHGRTELVNGVEHTATKLKHSSTTKQNIPLQKEIHQYNGLISFIGMDSTQIKEKLGEPQRIDRSSYDYDWWVYNTNPQNYIQVGIENGRVVTVYGTGDDVLVEPFAIGQPVEEIRSKGLIKPKISLNVDKNPYRFELTDNELNARPLIAMGNVYIQLYVDTFTDKISSIRFLDGRTLIKLRPYELAYRGELLSAKEVIPEKWQEIEQGTKAQILDITNVIRLRHGIQPLKSDEQLADVAYLHSKDMRVNQYFDHISPTKGGLADRLADGEISYQLAGENIAAKYVDGIAAVEGWLNSEGHRETLLNEEYNYLGVGVYEKYYTQNFIQAWDEEDQ